MLDILMAARPSPIFSYQLPVASNATLASSAPPPRDTEQGPPRSEGVVPFPREAGREGEGAKRLRGCFIVSGCGSRSEEHTSELQSQSNLVCRLLLEKKKNTQRPAGMTSTSCDLTPRRCC